MASGIENFTQMIIKALKKGWPYGVAVASVILSVVPESCFQITIFEKLSPDYNIIAIRLILCGILILGSWFLCILALLLKPWVTIKGHNYKIIIQYGDILRKKKGKKVIGFDECFTTKVGPDTGDINANSLCGKYLQRHPITDTKMENLLNQSKLNPCRIPSKYKGKPCYKPGSMVLRDSYLLMAFTKLNEKGRSSMTYKDYLECLELMWTSIDDLYGQEDVYIPVLGAGTTKFEDWDPEPQDLVNVILNSYKLSRDKLKTNKIHIACDRKSGIVLNKIDGT